MLYSFVALILFIFLGGLSFYKIRTGKKIAEFIYSYGFILGSFVWEDLFVISLYFLILSLFALYFAQFKLLLLGFFIFWVIRGLGETIYWFLQQFIRPRHYPHNVEEHFAFMRRIFGSISAQQCMIIMQVFLQIITMLSTVAVIFLLKNWASLP
jgi:hypothetical protein